MSDYILQTHSNGTFSGNKPKNIIILCHGYGGDGKDINVLAENWKRFLPDTIFLSPNAPEVCKINPQGYQWFDLESDKEEEILKNSINAENKLNVFIDQALAKFNLESKQLALVGFSQGSMISIQTALKRKKEINCLISYSGRIISISHLSKSIVSKPNFFLMHGENDDIVQASYLLEAKEFLNEKKIKVKVKLFKECQHTIPAQGLSLGLEYLKKNFYF
tara:strand:- start:12608 stop:13267 length:660 start_codon:yes stop_codon:yes gene_type:complete